MIKTPLPALCLASVMLLTACTAAPKPRLYDTLVVQNGTGGMIRTLSVTGRSDGTGARMGSVSPLPVGTAYFFKRPDKAGRLPDAVRARWIDASGEAREAVLDISPYLDAPSPERTLVLELLPGGRYRITPR